jgi:hypothetical protein
MDACVCTHMRAGLYRCDVEQPFEEDDERLRRDLPPVARRARAKRTRPDQALKMRACVPACMRKGVKDCAHACVRTCVRVLVRARVCELRSERAVVVRPEKDLVAAELEHQRRHRP